MKPFRARLLFVLLALLAVGTAKGQTEKSPATTQTPVVFSGGHETEGKDRGRPVILIAAALGVPSEVFREAFSHVHPAPAGTQPDPQQARDNKAALMNALRRYGVTNERLDTVSNYYRYVRSRNEIWPIKPATAYAVIKDGVVTKYVVTAGGSGYSSPPTIAVPGVSGATGTAQIAFGKDFDKNGTVSAIMPSPTKASSNSSKP